MRNTNGHTTRVEARTAGRVRLPATGWLVALALAAMLAVNAAGVWEISVARRAVRDEALRLLRAETVAQASAIEAQLAATRSELAFLAGSAPLAGLGVRGSTASREDVGSALILFLRGHPEVASFVVRSGDGTAWLAAGRPRSVPGFWIPAGAVDAGRLSTSIDIIQAPGARLDAALEPDALLRQGKAAADIATPSSCTLADGTGALLAADPGARDANTDGPPSAPGGPLRLEARADVHTEGWTAPATLQLRCARHQNAAVAALEPLAARYRTTILLNLAVMALTMLLGAFAIQQARRRQALELRAEEEARVRELQRQLFHAERLATVGRLAAGMAHEINNPLEGMANYLHLAREQLATGDAAGARGQLERVGEGLERAAAIVCRVLDHADPDAPPHENMDLGEVLRQTVDFVRARREFAHLRFECEIDPAARPVRGSPVMLGQVFLNLLLNACEAQIEGGEVRATLHDDGARVEVAVADRGPGLPPTDARRIFEPFYTTKRSSGLGLSICHSIVEQHRGELLAERREGGGAVFRVRLPGLITAPGAPPSSV